MTELTNFEEFKEIKRIHEKEYLNSGCGLGEDDVDFLIEEVERLREALKFYADDENYETKIVINPGRNNHYREILCDEGNIARKALEETK